MFEPYLKRWSLTPDGEAIITRSSHLLPVIWRGLLAMLKVALDIDEKLGSQILRWFDGDGAAHVYEYDSDAVLLERATGKGSLMTMAMEGGDDEASRIICRTAAKLHAPRATPLPDLVPLDCWFRELEPAARAHGGLLTTCAEIARHLLADQCDLAVLHGDIHHENIMDFGPRGWLAIDPKRVYGERGYDFSNTFCNSQLNIVTAPGRLQRQLPIVCAEARLEPKRMLKWIVAYAGLSASWFLSDKDTRNAEPDFSVARIALAELQI
ncbi:aminoglycoside phosphotransferase family protein [Rhizobium calliandrae]|uniref:Aminoglycoside phosphotransferase family protein n=1 Tax=Rhizobium calliandrae TaxID=1312182 RepID=A0ABT7K9F3_9HYPH|nr:aminoglycoside phosphotransferase family protein [Rhizobium calliandrae]MDL2405131.1 aminoglycoside phosphotransferase family protein [Rhizobium calliandrae]